MFTKCIEVASIALRNSSEGSMLKKQKIWIRWRKK